MRFLSWNMNGRPMNWAEVWAQDVAVALLQEAPEPSVQERPRILPGPESQWMTMGMARRPWSTAIAAISDKVDLRPRALCGVHEESDGALLVSRPGTLALADLLVDGQPRLTLASMYATWESPPGSGGSPMYADASAHRLLSDLSAVLVGPSAQIPLIAAGDLNILYGYGEDGDPYWARRYQSVFDRAGALGLTFVGPQAPNGRPADPWPDELPSESGNVPTFYPSRRNPSTAARQLDFVFASKSIADQVTVTALNHPDQWGPSDHCRIIIEFESSWNSSTA